VPVVGKVSAEAIRSHGRNVRSAGDCGTIVWSSSCLWRFGWGLAASNKNRVPYPRSKGSRRRASKPRSAARGPPRFAADGREGPHRDRWFANAPIVIAAGKLATKRGGVMPKEQCRRGGTASLAGCRTGGFTVVVAGGYQGGSTAALLRHGHSSSSHRPSDGGGGAVGIEGAVRAKEPGFRQADVQPAGRRRLRFAAKLSTVRQDGQPQGKPRGRNSSRRSDGKGDLLGLWARTASSALDTGWDDGCKPASKGVVAHSGNRNAPAGGEVFANYGPRATSEHGSDGQGHRPRTGESADGGGLAFTNIRSPPSRQGRFTTRSRAFPQGGHAMAEGRLGGRQAAPASSRRCTRLHDSTVDAAAVDVFGGKARQSPQSSRSARRTRKAHDLAR